MCLESRKADNIYSALDVVLRSYNKEGFYIPKIRCDNKFRSVMEDIQDDLDAEIDCVPQGEHVPEAERNNCTIGERVRAGYHRLPYCTIPKMMLKYLVMLSCKQLNFFRQRMVFHRTLAHI